MEEGCIVVHKKPLVHCTAWTLHLVYNSWLEPSLSYVLEGSITLDLLMEEGYIVVDKKPWWIILLGL